MTWHQPLVLAVEEALEEIFIEKRYADKVLEKTFKKNRKFGSRDRRLIAESVYDIVRFERKYSAAMKTDKWYDLLLASLVSRDGDIADYFQISQLGKNKITEQLNQTFSFSIAESYPDWIVALFEKEFKAEAHELLKSLNQQAPVYLRINSLKASLPQVIDSLRADEIAAEKVEKVESALKLVKRKNVFTTQAFKSGFFEVQDAASQFIAPLLAPKPGERIIDACAGAGGKALHIAALMKNKGKIIATDIHQWKLDELRKRASRNGVDIIETKLIDTSKVIKRFENSFDGVLLDVPCSGLGVLRRNPDSKWKLSQAEIDRLIILQSEILNDYSKLAKAKGRMVYSTCSVLFQENEQQVAKFLASEAGKVWKLEKEIRLWPHRDGFDGFYAALLVKN